MGHKDKPGKMPKALQEAVDRLEEVRKHYLSVMPEGTILLYVELSPDDGTLTVCRNGEFSPGQLAALAGVVLSDMLMGGADPIEILKIALVATGGETVTVYKDQEQDNTRNSEVAYSHLYKMLTAIGGEPPTAEEKAIYKKDRPA